MADSGVCSKFAGFCASRFIVCHIFIPVPVLQAIVCKDKMMFLFYPIVLESLTVLDAQPKFVRFSLISPPIPYHKQWDTCRGKPRAKKSRLPRPYSNPLNNHRKNHAKPARTHAINFCCRFAWHSLSGRCLFCWLLPNNFTAATSLRFAHRCGRMQWRDRKLPVCLANEIYALPSRRFIA